MGTLRVRNLAQKVLWEEELTGQLSDGRWENSRPYDHWEPWCNATVVVDPDNVGRDFYTRRDGYCFTEKELLSIVGERMLGYVRNALGLNEDAYTWDDMLKDLRDLRKIIKTHAASRPAPPQPVGRAGVTRVDGYDESITVYAPAPVALVPDAPARTYTFADFDV